MPKWNVTEWSVDIKSVHLTESNRARTQCAVALESADDKQTTVFCNEVTRWIRINFETLGDFESHRLNFVNLYFLPLDFSASKTDSLFGCDSLFKTCEKRNFLSPKAQSEGKPVWVGQHTFACTMITINVRYFMRNDMLNTILKTNLDVIIWAGFCGGRFHSNHYVDDCS